ADVNIVVAAGHHSLIATVKDIYNNSASVSFDFVIDAPLLQIVEGDGQDGLEGKCLEKELKVRVVGPLPPPPSSGIEKPGQTITSNFRQKHTEEYVPLEGVQLSFAVLEGGGYFAASNSAATYTNAEGIAAIRYILGQSPGANRVEVSVLGDDTIAPVEFNLTSDVPTMLGTSMTQFSLGEHKEVTEISIGNVNEILVRMTSPAKATAIEVKAEIVTAGIGEFINDSALADIIGGTAQYQGSAKFYFRVNDLANETPYKMRFTLPEFVDSAGEAVKLEVDGLAVQPYAIVLANPPRVYFEDFPKVSGDGQLGAAGQELPEPFVLEGIQTDTTASDVSFVTPATFSSTGGRFRVSKGTLVSSNADMSAISLNGERIGSSQVEAVAVYFTPTKDGEVEALSGYWFNSTTPGLEGWRNSGHKFTILGTQEKAVVKNTQGEYVQTSSIATVDPRLATDDYAFWLEAKTAVGVMPNNIGIQSFNACGELKTSIAHAIAPVEIYSNEITWQDVTPAGETRFSKWRSNEKFVATNTLLLPSEEDNPPQLSTAYKFIQMTDLGSLMPYTETLPPTTITAKPTLSKPGSTTTSNLHFQANQEQPEKKPAGPVRRVAIIQNATHQEGDDWSEESPQFIYRKDPLTGGVNIKFKVSAQNLTLADVQWVYDTSSEEIRLVEEREQREDQQGFIVLKFTPAEIFANRRKNYEVYANVILTRKMTPDQMLKPIKVSPVTVRVALDIDVSNYPLPIQEDFRRGLLLANLLLGVAPYNNILPFFNKTTEDGIAWGSNDYPITFDTDILKHYQDINITQDLADRINSNSYKLLYELSSPYPFSHATAQTLIYANIPNKFTGDFKVFGVLLYPSSFSTVEDLAAIVKHEQGHCEFRKFIKAQKDPDMLPKDGEHFRTFINDPVFRSFTITNDATQNEIYQNTISVYSVVFEHTRLFCDDILNPDFSYKYLKNHLSYFKGNYNHAVRMFLQDWLSDRKRVNIQPDVKGLGEFDGVKLTEEITEGIITKTRVQEYLERIYEDIHKEFPEIEYYKNEDEMGNPFV
ncbi:hypothetical protein HY605_02075, partial [Candidatus Peregrinibacteria bacterium]|nr:hypothetical protein [Candidatus Peregrinibacteria bacterium]